MQLRDLDPGEFYAVGPAFEKGVNLIKVGNVATTHFEVGKKIKARGKIKATGRMLKVLEKLGELPREAEEEAKTKQDLVTLNDQLKWENKTWERQNAELRKELEALKKTGRERTKDIEERTIKKFKVKMAKELQTLAKNLTADSFTAGTEFVPPAPPTLMVSGLSYDARKQKVVEIKPTKVRTSDDSENNLGRCEREILKVLQSQPNRSFTKVQLGFLSGYSPNSGGFNNALSKLSQLNLIFRMNSEYGVSDAGLIFSTGARPVAKQDWRSKLPKCEGTIYDVLEKARERAFSKNDLGDMTGYSPNSGGFNNALSKLSSIGLVKRVGAGFVQFNPEIAEL